VFNLIVAVVCDAVATVDRQSRADQRKEEEQIHVGGDDRDDDPVNDDSDAAMNMLLQAQHRIYDLSVRVLDMKNRQMELLIVVDRLSDVATELKSETNGALGIGMDDSSEAYDLSGAASGIAMGRDDASDLEVGALAFQEQIDQVSYQLMRFREVEEEEEEESGPQ
jgi:hypothetical protein